MFETLSGFIRALPMLDEKEVRDAECLAVFRMLSSLGYVEASPAMNTFLEADYTADDLRRVRNDRPRLVRAINAGIAASGL